MAYIQLIRSGAGVGIVPRSAGRTLPDLVEVLGGAPSTTLPVWLVVYREIHDSPLIRIVFDHLSDYLVHTLSE